MDNRVVFKYNYNDVMTAYEILDVCKSGKIDSITKTRFRGTVICPISYVAVISTVLFIVVSLISNFKFEYVVITLLLIICSIPIVGLAIFSRSVIKDVVIAENSIFYNNWSDRIHICERLLLSGNVKYQGHEFKRDDKGTVVFLCDKVSEMLCDTNIFYHDLDFISVYLDGSYVAVYLPQGLRKVDK